jgi:hypothetical protein
MFGEGGGAGGAGGGAGGDGGAAGADGTTGAAAQAPGVKAEAKPAIGGKTDLSQVIYGRQDGQDEAAPEAEPEEQPQQPQKKPSFDELMQDPEYKAEFQKRFDKQFNKRFGENKAAQEQQKKLAPALSLLAGKYGVQAGDTDALLEAILGDNELIERQAYDKGMEPDTYREYNRVLAENQQLKAAEAERQKQAAVEQTYQKWVQQAEQAKQIYPGLDLRREAQNPQFAQLLGAGIDVATAYQVVHMGELQTQLVQRTAQEAKASTVKAIQATQNRPRENGASKQKAATVRSDPTKLSRSDFDEILRRAQRGDRIRY